MLGEEFEEDDVFSFQIVGGMLKTHQLHDSGGVFNGFCFGEHLNLGKFHRDLFPSVGGPPNGSDCKGSVPQNATEKIRLRNYTNLPRLMSACLPTWWLVLPLTVSGF